MIPLLLAPNSPTQASPHVEQFAGPIVKSTHFTSPLATSSRAEIRHKSEIAIEVKHENQPKSLKNKMSPTSPAGRPIGVPTKRAPTLIFDEDSPTPQYSTPKRRIFNSSMQTQTPPHSSEHQLKALTDESLSKNEKIQAILHELTDCQVSLVFSLPLSLSVLLSLLHTYTRRLQVLIFFSLSLSHSLHFSIYLYAGNNQTAGTTIDDREERARSIVFDCRWAHERLT